MLKKCAWARRRKKRELKTSKRRYADTQRKRESARKRNHWWFWLRLWRALISCIHNNNNLSAFWFTCKYVMRIIAQTHQKRSSARKETAKSNRPNKQKLIECTAQSFSFSSDFIPPANPTNLIRNWSSCAFQTRLHTDFYFTEEEMKQFSIHFQIEISSLL